MRVIPISRRWLTILLPIVLTGCTLRLVAPYDAVTDAAIQDLTRRTEVMIADVTQRRTSYQQHAAFYRDTEGTLRALQLRAGLYRRNEAEQQLLERLQQAYANLRELHQEIGPFRAAEAEGVRSLLRSLLHHQLSKKRAGSLAATTGS